MTAIATENVHQHENDLLHGKVTRILWPKSTREQEETNFRIFLVESTNGQVSCKGDSPGLSVGTKVACKGTWETHPTFGKTFKASSIVEDLPKDLNDIATYLAKAKIPGIGPKTAERIVTAFGTNVFDILDNHSEQLANVHGISVKTQQKITDAWTTKRASHTVMLFLQKHAISSGFAHTVYKHFGGEGISADSIIKQLTENPYQLAEIRGIGFKRADAMARSLNIAIDSPFRILAGTAHILKEASSMGDTMQLLSNVKTRVATLLELPESLISTCLSAKIPASRILELATFDKEEHLALTSLHRSEHLITDCISRLQRFGTPLLSKNSPELQKPFTIHQQSVTLQGKQADAIRMALTNSVSILTGQPGTGKTSICRAIVDICDQHARRVKACAPSGLAAIRLKEAIGIEATTIHRLLGMGYTERSTDERDVNADLLIVDETSMLGVPLLVELLQRVHPGTSILFVGDSDQLPSVEPGNVLSDMITSGKIPVTHLEEIHRQKSVKGGGSGIVYGCRDIINGEMPTFNATDFRFIAQPKTSDGRIDEKKSVAWVVQLIQKIHASGVPLRDIQILAPMHKGLLGVENLNIVLQQALNPPSISKREIVFRGVIFREGDRLIQTKNDYSEGMGVVNGDIGYVLAVDPEEETMTIAFTGERTVSIDDREKFENLSLNYACTVHKAQGSEYQVCCLMMNAFLPKLITRNLVYTGVTRAKSLCVTFGTKKALAVAIDTAGNSTRCTALGYFLSSL